MYDCNQIHVCFPIKSLKSLFKKKLFEKNKNILGMFALAANFRFHLMGIQTDRKIYCYRGFNFWRPKK